MIVCHCRAVSDREISAAVVEGAHHLPAVQAACGAGTDCHGCHRRIEQLLDAVRDRLGEPRPVLQAS